MPVYRVEKLPIEVSDSAVRELCEQFSVILLEGPTIGSDYVELKTEQVFTEEQIALIEAAIDEVIWKAIGKIRRID